MSVKTEAELYADDFGYRVWVIDPADILEPSPADPGAIVEAYTVAAIEARPASRAGAK